MRGNNGGTRYWQIRIVSLLLVGGLTYTKDCNIFTPQGLLTPSFFMHAFVLLCILLNESQMYVLIDCYFIYSRRNVCMLNGWLWVIRMVQVLPPSVLFFTLRSWDHVRIRRWTHYQDLNGKMLSTFISEWEDMYTFLYEYVQTFTSETGVGKDYWKYLRIRNWVFRASFQFLEDILHFQRKKLRVWRDG